MVTEKVHGANLCLLTPNGSEVHAARRNDILKSTGTRAEVSSCFCNQSESDTFFEGWVMIVDKYREAVLKAYHILREKRTKEDEAREAKAKSAAFQMGAVYIYGEFFGGIYPGLESQTPKGITHAQKGVLLDIVSDICSA